MIFAGPGQFPKTPRNSLFLRVAMLPIANVNTRSIIRHRDADRTKIRRWIDEKIFITNSPEGSAGAFDLDSAQVTLAEVSEEKIVSILGRKRVVSVAERAGRRAGAVIGHHPERVGTLRNEIERIPIKPA